MIEGELLLVIPSLKRRQVSGRLLTLKMRRLLTSALVVGSTSSQSINSVWIGLSRKLGERRRGELRRRILQYTSVPVAGSTSSLESVKKDAMPWSLEFAAKIISE